MTETFGTFSNPHPTTWNITNNVIWNLHHGNNKVIAANKAILLCLIVMVRDSGIRTRTMRNLVPWWNTTSIFTPDNKLAVDRFALTHASYDASMDYNRTFGRGR